MKKEVLLSIITPYYKCLEYIKELARVLESQLDENVEWIIVDDGCHEEALDSFNARVIHLEENSGCAGIPRNYGLDVARGKYITFIDADDLVPCYFVRNILKAIAIGFDYCLMSWKSDSFIVDISDGRPEWNCSVWGIVYNRDVIGDIRFGNERIAEDYAFNHKVLKDDMDVFKIYSIMYYYRDTPGSLMKSG